MLGHMMRVTLPIVLGSEEAWTMVGSSGGHTRVGVEATGDAPSSVVESVPMAIGQATPAAASVAEIGLGRPVQALQQLRRAHLRVAIVEVEEIVRELAQPPQVLHMVIRCGDEFNMLKEGEASEETKRLRADLLAMIG